MYSELLVTAILFLAVCLVITLLDALVCLLLCLAGGISFKVAFCRGLLALLVPAAVLAWGIIVGRNHYRVREVELRFDNLPEAFRGYRIVQLSDIHSRSFRHRTRSLRRAVKKVNSLGADLIAFTGDIITISPDELDITAPILGRLHAEDGVVSVLGNHDYGVYMSPGRGVHHTAGCTAEIVRRERQLGWKVLLDENVTITRGDDTLAVLGVQNTTPSPHFRSAGDLQKASEDTEGLFRILLSHDPMHWDMEVVGKDYPLTLSGHTHAMQFSLFGWCPSRYMFRQYRGLYEEGGQKLYVNIGLGETIFPARIGTPPEITLITLL